jgi:hypothetical protein
MKKITLFSTVLLTFGALSSVQAQTVDQKTRALVVKFSETWCGPCGAYAVPLTDSFLPKMNAADNGCFLNIKSSSNPSSMNSVGGDIMAGASGYNIDGYPSILINSAANNLDFNNVIVAGDVNQVMSAINTEIATAAVANIGADFSIANNKVTVKTKVKFNQAVTGEYSIAVFLYEDKISAQQNGYPGGAAIHHNVLRGGMSSTTSTSLASSPWGEAVGTTTITNGQEFSKTFSVDVNSGWISANLNAVVVVFKKENNKFKAINSRYGKSGNTTSLNNLTTVENVTVYPNPATTNLNINVKATASNQLNIKLVDLTGRVLIQESNTVVSGDNNLTINTALLSAGNYILNITDNNGGSMNKTIAITK